MPTQESRRNQKQKPKKRSKVNAREDFAFNITNLIKNKSFMAIFLHIFLKKILSETPAHALRVSYICTHMQVRKMCTFES